MQYGLFEEFSERNKLGTKNLKTKESKCHLTDLNLANNGNVIDFSI